MLWTAYFRRQNSTYLISFVQNWILRQKAKNWYLPQCEQRQPNISFTTIHLKQKLGGNSRWFLAKIQTFEGNHQVWKWIHLFQPENNRKTFSKWSFQFWSMRSRCIDKKKNCTFICTLFSFANFPQRGQIWLDLLVEVWECFFGFSISASMYNCIEKLIPHWIFTNFFLSIFFKRIFLFCVKMGKKLQSTSKFVW